MRFIIEILYYYTALSNKYCGFPEMINSKIDLGYLIKYLLSTFYVPDSVLGTGDTVVNKRDMVFVLAGLWSTSGGDVSAQFQ